MEENNLSTTIQQTVEELLSRAGFQVKTELKSELQDGQENLTCNIITEEDSSFLIGQYGANLQALQHIVRLAVRKKTGDSETKFVLDVNSYRAEKNEAIADMARQAAEQALSEGRAIVLRPMTPYERRLIHMELSQNPKVVTESIGEGENRKVVVKPAGTI